VTTGQIDTVYSKPVGLNLFVHAAICIDCHTHIRLFFLHQWNVEQVT